MIEPTDYCTAFPEGWWQHCCEAHDAAYDAQIGKAQADKELLACVVESRPGWAEQFPMAADGASALVGLLMFAGVSLFGRRFYKRAGKQQSKP